MLGAGRPSRYIALEGWRVPRRRRAGQPTRLDRTPGRNRARVRGVTRQPDETGINQLALGSTRRRDHEDARGSAVAVRGRRPAVGRRLRQRGALRRLQLRRSCSTPCCDAQCCFSDCQQQCKTCYKLVYDTVLEKRWHTCYQTVNETVMKPVCKTCYKTVQETCSRTSRRPATRTSRSTAPAGHQTCYKDCEYTVQKPCYQKGFKEVLRDGMQAGLRDLLEGVPLHRLPQGPRVLHEGSAAAPSASRCARQHCYQHCYQVCTKICEQHCKEVCCHRCREVCEVTAQECCHVCTAGDESAAKEVCATAARRPSTRPATRSASRRSARRCCTMKTVQKKCGEWCCETYCVPGKHDHQVGGLLRVLLRPLHLPDRDQAPQGQGLLRGLPGKSAPARSGRSTWCASRCPARPRQAEGRRKGALHGLQEGAATPSCKKVPVTCTRTLRGAYVNEKGVATECQAPGSKIVEGAVVRTKVPYTVKRMVRRRASSRCRTPRCVALAGPTWSVRPPRPLNARRRLQCRQHLRHRRPGPDLR